MSFLFSRSRGVGYGDTTNDIGDVDDASSSNASSTQSQTVIKDLINHETERRRRKSSSLKQNNSVGESGPAADQAAADDHGTLGNQDRGKHSSPLRLAASSENTGIMTVRTLEESLTLLDADSPWKTVVDNQRKRRRMRKRMNEIRKEASKSSFHDCKVGTERPQSATGSILSDLITTSSSIYSTTVSGEKFNVRFESIICRHHLMIPGDNPR